MKKLIPVIAAFLMAFSTAAQDYDFITELPDDFAQLDTVPPPRKFTNIHMIGVNYGVSLCSVYATPDVKSSFVFSYNNFGIDYTYYHALWDYLFNFGLKVGLRHGYQGYASEYPGYGEKCEVVQMPVVSQFKIDFSQCRFLINLGAFAGYRIATDRMGGFDQYDQRFSYGALGGLGFAVVLNPIELHLEGDFHYSFDSLYHANKYSDLYWMFAHPINIVISLGVHIHL